MWRTSLFALVAGLGSSVLAQNNPATVDRDAWTHELQRANDELAALQAILDASTDPSVRSQAADRIRSLKRIVSERLRELRPEEPPTAPPPSAAPAFVEMFDDNRQGWTLGDDGRCNANIVDGTLQLSSDRGMSGKNCRYWWPFHGELNAFRAEFDAQYKDGPSNYGFGLIFRAAAAQGQHSSYLAMISAQGEAAVFSSYDAKWTSLAPWHPSAAIRLGRAVNRLRVEANQDTIRVTVNGEVVAEAGAPGVSESQIGFYLDVPGLQVAFDTLGLTDLSATQAQAPAFAPPARTFSPPPAEPAPAPVRTFSPQPAEPPPPPPPAPAPPPAAPAPPPTPVRVVAPTTSPGNEIQSLLGALASVGQPKEQKRIVTEYASYRKVTVRDVMQIMQRFSNSADRVEVAGYLYVSVADPENWSQVYAELGSKPDADRLAQWVAAIDQKPKPRLRPRGRQGAGPAMDVNAFGSLMQNVAAVKGQQRLAVVRDAARTGFFSSDEVLEILRSFQSTAERRQAGVTLWARLTDPENTFLLFAAAPGLQDDLIRAYSPPR
jgi:hypothetical protein